MYEHKAAVIVPAPVEEVYALMTHFHRYPDLMRHVESVTFYDDQNCHWVTNAGGRREWDAVNEGWRPNERIGWNSTHGPKHAGEALFRPLGKGATLLFVRLNYQVPATDGSRSLEIDHALQQDLDLFAFAVGQVERNGGELDWNAIAREQAAAQPVRPARTTRSTHGTIANRPSETAPAR
jgi:uncharacterized membrane protein